MEFYASQGSSQLKHNLHGPACPRPRVKRFHVKRPRRLGEGEGEVAGSCWSRNILRLDARGRAGRSHRANGWDTRCCLGWGGNWEWLVRSGSQGLLACGWAEIYTGIRFVHFNPLPPFSVLHRLKKDVDADIRRATKCTCCNIRAPKEY